MRAVAEIDHVRPMRGLVRVSLRGGACFDVPDSVMSEEGWNEARRVELSTSETEGDVEADLVYEADHVQGDVWSAGGLILRVPGVNARRHLRILANFH